VCARVVAQLQSRAGRWRRPGAPREPLRSRRWRSEGRCSRSAARGCARCPSGGSSAGGGIGAETRRPGPARTEEEQPRVGGEGRSGGRSGSSGISHQLGENVRAMGAAALSREVVVALFAVPALSDAVSPTAPSTSLRDRSRLARRNADAALAVMDSHSALGRGPRVLGSGPRCAIRIAAGAVAPCEAADTRKSVNGRAAARRKRRARHDLLQQLPS